MGHVTIALVIPRRSIDRLHGCRVVIVLIVIVLVRCVCADDQPMHITVTESAGVYRLPEPGEVSLYSTPVQYQVLRREQFAGRLHDLPEVLSRALDVQVQQSGGLGSFSTMTLRGASSEQVQVFVDGVPLNDAADGVVDLSLIPVDELERIEVFRGATPVELGGGSIGGAVNLVTRKTSDESAVRALAGIGSFGTRQLEASATFGGDSGRWLIGAGALASDNDFEITNDNGTGFNPDDDFDEPRNNADFSQYNLFGKWNRDLAGDKSLTATLQGFDKEQGIPDLDNSPDASTRLATGIVRAHGKLDFLRLGSAATSASTSLSFIRRTETYDDRDAQIGLLPQHNQGVTRRAGIEGFLNHILGATTLRGIGEYYHERYEFEDLLDVQPASTSTRHAFTLGGEANRYYLDNRLIGSLVLRAQRVEDHLEVTDLNTGLEPQVTDNTYQFLSPQAGLKYVLNAQSSIKANVGHYARAPTFLELFGNRGIFVGNPDLEPEQSTNLDLGAEYSWFGPGRWYHGTRLSAEAFWNRAEDLIVRVFNAQGIGRSENVSDSSILGVGLAFESTPVAPLLLQASATWLDTRIDSELVAFDGNQLPGRWHESWRALAGWLQGLWTYSAELQVRRDMFFDTANLLPADDQQVVNLAAGRRTPRWALNLRVDNLFDERYQDFNGFPKPGRSFFVTASFQF